MMISNPLKKFQKIMRNKLLTKSDWKSGFDFYYCVQKFSAYNFLGNSFAFFFNGFEFVASNFAFHGRILKKWSPISTFH